MSHQANSHTNSPLAAGAEVLPEDLISIEVDGQRLQGRKGDMLIEVTDQAGINIPRFCYHRKLSIAANCRMCLVEVERAPKPLPACSTPISEGMRVQTRSRKALAAQRATMEFLLINHPLDCPICDQGGECELQDLAMGYGEGVGQYSETKRVVKDKDIGALIATDMTRCIHCTRCVRFGEEIAGLKELGAVGRSEHMEIGTYIAKSVTSELSGNVIDLCPVGALTAKPSRYTARPWELVQQPHLSTHDAWGSNLYLHTRGGRIMRTVPRENDAINETWLADRDRFAYTGLFTEDRLTTPMLRREGVWQATDWDTALGFVAERLQAIAQQQGGGAIGGLISPQSSLEELYLFQKLIRGLGSNHVDHRLRQVDFSADGGDPVMPWFGMDIPAFETQKVIVTVGLTVREEIPLLGHRLRQAATEHRATVHVVHPFEQALTFTAQQWPVAGETGMLDFMIALARAAGVSLPDSLGEGAAAPTMVATVLADLQRTGATTLMLGALVQQDAHFGAIRYLAAQVAKATGATLSLLPQGANAAGAWLAGAVPHRLPGGQSAVGTGDSAQSLLSQPKPAMLLFGVEPSRDTAAGAAAIESLRQAECVICATAYDTPELRALADVLLPIGSAVETAGTWVNGEGRWQPQRGVVGALGAARPGWKVLRVLGNLLDLAGFDYLDAAQVRSEVQTHCANITLSNHSDVLGAVLRPSASAEGWLRLAPVSPYSVDSVVRRAEPLHATELAARHRSCLMNPVDAAAAGFAAGDRLRVTQAGHIAVLPLVLDEGVPPGSVVVPVTAASAALPARVGRVSLSQEVA